MASTHPGRSLLDRFDELRMAESPRLVLVEHAAPTEPSSVALLSGSFDPLTVAHAALAEAAFKRVELVVLVYSVRRLPKEGDAADALLSEPDRILQLEAFCESRSTAVPALASHPLLADHVDAAANRFPGTALSLAMGSDKALQVLDPKWYPNRDAVLRRLFDRAGILYAERAGEVGAVPEALKRPENRPWRDRFERLSVRPDVAAVSSREVRAMLARGEDVSDLVPDEVLAYLRLGR
jgi:nicotinic acid mononucleotide adenylyltransferase